MTAALRSLRRMLGREPSWTSEITEFEQFRDALGKACRTTVAHHRIA